MQIKNRQRSEIPEAQVTPKDVYLNRRQFMSGTIISAAALSTSSLAADSLLTSTGNIAKQNKITTHSPTNVNSSSEPSAAWQQAIVTAKKTDIGKGQTLTPQRAVTSYNNFYEFGMDKSDPAQYGDSLKPFPWQVSIEGLCAKPGIYDLEDLVKGIDLEERIYRLRCVEAWSMVIPWIGFPLSKLIKRCQPSANAKFVEFKTLVDKDQMPAQASPFSTIDWPYTEGLRLDEAMHPLTLMAVGLYGELLPNQNGAPWRLVVPWKYGFKSIKSVVSLRFTETMPKTSWNSLAPREYGFYANVNPTVDHPRWSQASERRLPSGLFAVNRIKTEMFNGYGEEVADLYRGMDLHRFY